MKPFRPLHNQIGLTGILISGILSVALALAGIQNSKSTAMTAYHLDKKIGVEEAYGIAEGGYLYYKHLMTNKGRVNQLINRWQNDGQVVLAGCTPQNNVPDRLTPTKIIEEPDVPYRRQSMSVKAIFAPKDCSAPINADNFRAVFSIMGGINCESDDMEENLERCVARSMVLSVDSGSVYRTQAPRVPVATPTPPVSGPININVRF